MNKNQTSITLSAPAKINFTLDVLSRRPDGYHDLSTIMQAVSLADTVTVDAVRAEETTVQLTTDKSFLPTDDRNIACKAAKAFLESAGITAAVKIDLQKQIPVGAGMGGGSSDAAAVLRALAALLQVELPPETMNRLAKSIGADVPFALDGGCALAEGIGEVLKPLPVFTGIPLVICKPRASVATKSIFTRFRVDAVAEHPDTAGALSAIRGRNLSALAFRLFNVLEPVTSELCPPIAEYRRALLKAGALGTVMTGSGTAVFGIFADRAAAETAEKLLKPQCDFVWCAETIGPNPQL